MDTTQKLINLHIIYMTSTNKNRRFSKYYFYSGYALPIERVDIYNKLMFTLK